MRQVGQLPRNINNYSEKEKVERKGNQTNRSFFSSGVYFSRVKIYYEIKKKIYYAIVIPGSILDDQDELIFFCVRNSCRKIFRMPLRFFLLTYLMMFSKIHVSQQPFIHTFKSQIQLNNTVNIPFTWQFRFLYTRSHDCAIINRSVSAM